MHSQTREDFEFHPLSGFGPVDDIAHDIRTRREVMFKGRFAGTSHVCQDSLAEMPTEQLVGWTVGMGLQF